MWAKNIRFLRCPGCTSPVKLLASNQVGERIESGKLGCESCAGVYPIVEFIPRFVTSDNYAASFGLEWTIHARTQYDSNSGGESSQERFFAETGWPRSLEGDLVIEAGSGSGRFTEQALNTGATVLSLDYSRAVEANYRSNGANDRLVLVQGDLFTMPFPPGVADRLFCFGVLQHTPDPALALAALVPMVRPGGSIVADIYAKTFARYVMNTKYWLRPLTRRIAPDRLYRLTERYVNVTWPLVRQVQRIPRIGRPLSWRLLIPDYTYAVPSDAAAKEWARLDIFDMLSPRYDKPARATTISRWCDAMDVEGVEIERSLHGFVIRMRRRTSGSGDLRAPTA